MSKAIVLASDGSFFVGREHFAGKQTYSGVLGDDRCGCFDPGCAHPSESGRHTNQCTRKASTTLWRVDMNDQDGTRFCDECADDAMESGLFCGLDEDGDEEDE